MVRRHLGADRDRQGNAMRIVITGGAGMIGSHLVDALLDGGSEIVIVDNLLTGRRENLAHLAASPRVRVVEADISAASNLPETVGPVYFACHPWDGSRRPTSRPGSSAH